MEKRNTTRKKTQHREDVGKGGWTRKRKENKGQKNRKIWRQKNKGKRVRE
jgi:hypothetical protein